MNKLLHFPISRLVAAAGVALISFGSVSPAAIAASRVFGQKEVEPGQVIALAAPYGGGNAYQLLILEQLTNARPCWSESGANPTVVDPLLLQFDFTKICGRSTDSNGYSVRMAGRDFGLVYDLDIVRRDNDLVLIATNINDRKAPVLEVGRTNGLPPAGQFAKINLNPGWRLTKRTQDNKELGHVYLTADNLPPGVTAAAFVDTQSHWARAYIDALAARGIISGFSEDNTFRPDDPVTRVQFAAIVSKAFASLPPKRDKSAASFKDVAANFWGKDAIQTAYALGFMSGYPGDLFKPDQNIPRLEVLVALSSGLNFTSTDTAALAYYQDAAQIPDWASGSISGATQKGIVVNYPRVKELNPNRTATRADVAAFVYQTLVDAGQLPVIPSPYVAGAPSSPTTTPTSPGNLTAPTNPTPPLQQTAPAPIAPPTTPAPVESPAPVAPPPAPVESPPVAPAPAPVESPPVAPAPGASPSPPATPQGSGGVVVPTTPVSP